MRSQARHWILGSLAVPLLCVGLMVAFPVGYGTGDPPDLIDAVGLFSATVVSFAQVTVFQFEWWVLGVSVFVAFRVRERDGAT